MQCVLTTTAAPASFRAAPHTSHPHPAMHPTVLASALSWARPHARLRSYSRSARLGLTELDSRELGSRSARARLGSLSALAWLGSRSRSAHPHHARALHVHAVCTARMMCTCARHARSFSSRTRLGSRSRSARPQFVLRSRSALLGSSSALAQLGLIDGKQTTQAYDKQAMQMSAACPAARGGITCGQRADTPHAEVGCVHTRGAAVAVAAPRADISYLRKNEARALHTSHVPEIGRNLSTTKRPRGTRPLDSL